VDGVIDGVKFISGAVNYNGDQSRFCKKQILKEMHCLYCVDLPATGQSEFGAGYY
jgi:alcohol dehydrogenase YqhD (iron-dependent ADH family)